MAMKKIIAGFAVVWSCSGVAQAQTTAPAEGGAELNEAVKALGMLFGGAGDKSSTPAIHQRQLRELLPAEFSGMKRSNMEAGKQSALGLNISYAQATYTAGDTQIEAKISDVSSMGEFMKMAQYAWAQNEMERESEEGYERTITLGGHTGQESFQNEGKRGRIQVMVDGRFVVEIDGSGVEMEKLHELVKTIDLGKLAALQPLPPETAPATTPAPETN
jgi:hypothetical protein